MRERKDNIFLRLWRSDKSIIAMLSSACIVLFSFTCFRIFYIQNKLLIAIISAVLSAVLLLGLFTLLIKKIGGLKAAADKIRNQKIVFLSLFLSLIITVFIFCVYTLSPFGDYTVLRMDLYHQYGPLFAELYDKTAASKSLLYSWNSGGGSGFLGNFFNYLSSPFTLMIFWFSRKEVVTTGISFVIFAKLIACSGTFSYYLKKRFDDSSYSIAAFSLLYAFSGYFIAYFWNVMWLDAVVVFPLVLLGIERIIDKSDSKLYFVSLIYSFLTNYYMAYMICIFSVLYFIVYYVSNHKISELYVPKTRDLPKFSRIRQSRLLCSGLRFAFVSVFAALCCGAVLIPIFKVLKSSSATGSSFPSEVKTYFDMYNFLVSHFSALEPTIRSSGEQVTPNIYCGIISVILFPLYIMNKRIGWKEKIANFILLAFLFVSFNINVLNFIWHGFHFPNDLPYRFSFMYSFIFLICAYKVFKHIRDYSYKTLVLVGGILIFVCIVAQKYDIEYSDNFTIYSTIAFIVLYTIIICASISKKLSKVMTSVVLCCAVLCEVLICDVPKFAFGVSESDYVSDYDRYQKELDYIKQNDNSFYRTELNDIPTALRMSPCWYNYEGINCFSSMASESVSNLQFNLGNFSNKINSFMYHNQTPIYNLMFNVKYVIDNNNPIKLNEEYYTYLRGNQESLTTYKNNYDSSIAFCVNRDVYKAWKTEDYKNPFELQNEFLQLATGIEEDFFIKAKFYTNGAQNCSITSFENDGDGSISLSVFDSESSANFNTDFTAEEKGNYYLYFGSTSLFERAEIDIDGIRKIQEIDNEPYILDLGALKKSQEVNIKTYIKEDISGGSGYLWAYRLNDEAFKKAYDIINDAGMMKVTSKTDTQIKGVVSSKKGEMLYTSLAYDNGWQVFVDGVKVKPEKLNDSLLALEIGEGRHEIIFKYFPEGLKTGLVISGAPISAIALFFIIKKALIYAIKVATDKMVSLNDEEGKSNTQN